MVIVAFCPSDDREASPSCMRSHQVWVWVRVASRVSHIVICASTAPYNFSSQSPLSANAFNFLISAYACSASMYLSPSMRINVYPQWSQNVCTVDFHDRKGSGVGQSAHLLVREEGSLPLITPFALDVSPSNLMKRKRLAASVLQGGCFSRSFLVVPLLSRQVQVWET
jgi:hypothetical protein